MKQVIKYILLILVCVMLVGCSGENDNRINMPSSSSDFEGAYYEDVVQELEDAGFTNITLEVLDDLITGWMTEDGEVEQVEVDGTTTFSTDSKYDKDVKIIVTFHTFPQSKTDDEAKESDENEQEDTTSDENVLTGEKTESVEENTEAISENADESILTIENCEELVAILNTKDEFDPIIKDFAEKYHGRIIEFDGNTAYVSPHEDYTTRYDYLIYAGDYSGTSAIGAMFQFRDVSYHDLNLTGENVPDSFGAGLNVYIVAKVGEYDENSGLLLIEPVSIEMR